MNKREIYEALGFPAWELLIGCVPFDANFCILSEVKKPLTERYWPWRVDTNGEWFRQRGNEQIRVPSEDHAKEAQALEDEPLLLARIEALEAERRWIPCSERLPEIGESVYVAVTNPLLPNGEPFEATAWRGESGWGYPPRFFGDKPAGMFSEPSHWQPLPSPPDRAQERGSE